MLSDPCNKKLLIVYDVAYPFVEGGGQRRLWEVAKRLAKQGYEIDWVCFKTWDEPLPEQKTDGINYIGLPGYKGLYRENGSRRIAEPIEFLVALWQSGIDLTKYDCIWSGQWPMVHLLWWVLWPRSIGNAKLVVDWWEIWGTTWFSYSKVAGWIGYLFEEALIRLLSSRGELVFIAPSALRKAKLIYPAGKFHLIHNGVDLSSFSYQKKQDSLWDIVYLGRLKNHKRVDLLIDAIHYLRLEHNRLLKMVIVGDGPEKSALLERTRQLNMSDQVFFAGRLPSAEEAIAVLSSSKIFVNPSTKEGGGSITLFEAMAAGLPVLAFDCKDGIDPELIRDNFAGKVVSPVTSVALANAILELFDDEQLMRRLKAGALESALEFDWGKISNSYSELFSSTSKNYLK